MAHTCNASNSEDHGLRILQAKVGETLSQKEDEHGNTYLRF
jgi:hypothetical protein